MCFPPILHDVDLNGGSFNTSFEWEINMPGQDTRVKVCLVSVATLIDAPQYYTEQ